MPVSVESGAAYENDNEALIGYHDLVADATLSADSEQTNHPVENLADGLTFDHWKPSSTGSQNVDIDLGNARTVDYAAIAAHNLSSELSGDVVVAFSDNGSDYTMAFTLSQASVTDNAPILIHLAARTHRYWRVTFPAASTALRVGVLYLGALLQMQRRIYRGNAPPSLQRADNVVPSLSESGHFLGRLITRSFYEATLSWERLKPDWYRTNFEPFVKTSRGRAFFIAWRPSDYPAEVVYAWRRGNIMPRHAGPRGWLSVQIKLQAHIGD